MVAGELIHGASHIQESKSMPSVMTPQSAPPAFQTTTLASQMSLLYAICTGVTLALRRRKNSSSVSAASALANPPRPIIHQMPTLTVGARCFASAITSPIWLFDTDPSTDGVRSRVPGIKFLAAAAAARLDLYQAPRPLGRLVSRRSSPKSRSASAGKRLRTRKANCISLRSWS
jgi:hypothetical protein